MSGPQNCAMCMGKFGFFKKQYTCPKCNCTTCKECLSNKIILSDSSSLNVCLRCYKKAQQPKNSGRVSPPANFKREMDRKEKEEIEETPENPHDRILRMRLDQLKESNKEQSSQKKTESVEELEQRLRKLSYDPKQEVTDDEIKYRLAKLKGSRPPAVKVHSLRRTQSTDTGTSNDTPKAGPSNETSSDTQVKKLIRQFTEEIAVDMDTEDFEKEFKPENVPSSSADDLIILAKIEIERSKQEIKSSQLEDMEVQKQLSQLPQVPSDHAGPSGINFNDEDMDAESASLIQRIMEEDQLEQDLIRKGMTVNPKPLIRQFEEEDSDENPWCFMCNDDAVTRCLTCDRELFCKTCFRIVHEEKGMRGHKTEKFISKDK